MSKIIKAEYVVYDNLSNKKPENTKCSNAKVISPKEDLYDIYNQREIILKEARDEAAKIISNAKRSALQEIVECKERAYDEGYKAGYEIGKNKGYEEGYGEGYEVGRVKSSEEIKNQNLKTMEEMAEMLETIEKEKEGIISKYESDLTKLAIDMAEKIINQKIDNKDNVIASIIRNLIKDYKNVEWVKIHISSMDDIISVQTDKGLINELNKISSDVKFEVSEHLDKGSAIVETPDGIVDGSINTQLKNLKEMVLSKNAI